MSILKIFVELTKGIQDFCGEIPRTIASLIPMATNGPGECLGIDVIGPLPITERGNRYILVMVDFFTKAEETVSIASQDAETIANLFADHWVSQHGVPTTYILTSGQISKVRSYNPCV